MKKKLLKNLIVPLMAVSMLFACGKKEDIVEPEEDLGSLEDVLDDAMAMPVETPTYETQETVSMDDASYGETVSENTISENAVSENEAEAPVLDTPPTGTTVAVTETTGPCDITIMNMCGYDCAKVTFVFEGVMDQGILVNGEKKLRDGGVCTYTFVDADTVRAHLPAKLIVTVEAKGTEPITFAPATILKLDDLHVILSYYNGEYIIETE